MYTIIIKDAARNMLDEAYEWYESQLAGLGERFIEEVEWSLDKIARSPFIYFIIGDEYRQHLMRTFPYKIIFEIQDQTIVVYSFFHTRRDPKHMFG